VPQFLSIAQVATDGQCVVRVAGEIDISTAPRLADYLDGLGGLGGQRVIVDLTEVSSIDSSGFDVLVAAHKNQEQDGGQLVLRGVSPAASESLQILGMHASLHLHGHA
jgi:anti-anti-sigma factor